jgi:hypothetical protein
MSVKKHLFDIDRVAAAMAFVAWLWFAFAAAWGMFQIPGGGHTGSGSAGTTGASLPIAHFGIFYPSSDWFAQTPPDPTTYYCHHPFGVFYLTAFFLWIFGARDFVVHLSPVLMSMAIPPLLYGIGKRYGGPVLGAVAACAYVVVPIAVGFANYNNMETPAIFGSLLFFWGHSAHQVTGLRRHMAASLLGLVVVCSSEWVGYLLVAPLLGWSTLRAFVLPARWTPRIRLVSYARWWGLSVGIAVGTLALWVFLFIKANKIGDWLASAEFRGGDGVSLKAVLAARKNWLYFSFTPLAIWLGAAASPISLLRVVVVRRDEEVYPLSILFGSIVHYVAFKRGADVHIFWPHYFAEYYGLAMAQLVSTVLAAGRKIFELLGKTLLPGATAWATLLVGVAPSIAMAPDAVRSLAVWRRSGGRYDDRASFSRSDVDLIYIVKSVVVPRSPRHSTIDVSPSSPWWWGHMWGYQGGYQNTEDPAHQQESSLHPFWLGLASGLNDGDQHRIAGLGHVEVYGDVWIVDQRKVQAPLDAWRIEEREPNPFQWLLYGGWEPVRRVGSAPDPLRTWEWRVHLKQSPIAAPAEIDAPTLDELRILYNVAVFDKADERAEHLRERIEAQLDRSVSVRFQQGIELIGVRVTSGAARRLETWFLASNPVASDLSFQIRARVQERARFSLIPPDTTDREVAIAPSLRTKLWKPQFIYKIDFDLNHRIGVEQYFGKWLGDGAPQRLDGRSETALVTVR